MAFFADKDEVYKYVGGIFEEAAEHPDIGPKFKAADVTMCVHYTDPDCDMTVRMTDPMTVEPDTDDPDADVHLYMTCDIADQYWRGEYNLPVGLAKGKVKAKGPVNKILKLVPLTKPLFPIYKERIAEKDKAAA